MSNGKQTKRPALGARILAALLAVVLAPCLWGQTASLLGLQGMTSTGLHTQVALAPDAVGRQMERIQGDLDALAEERGLDWQDLEGLVTQEAVEEFDRKIVAWWTGALATGKMEEEPTFAVEGLMERVQGDEAFLATVDPLLLRRTVEDIQGEISNSVRRSAVLFRDLLVQAGVRLVSDRVDLHQMVELLGKVPVITGLASLALAGMIALLLSRRIQAAGQYIGGAISACGLLSCLALGLIKGMNIRGMISEASLALEAQYAHLARIMTMEVMAVVVLAFLVGGGLMILAWRDKRKHG
ncbi:MAG: hypothetical protein IJ188_08010 [Clostridia bacterium]|nr:hypothetical protein [Clostridia bacterium]